MAMIQKDAYLFSVDIEKTKAYYQHHTLCDCTFCQNYYAKSKEALPELAAFLNQFGVDIAKPDEIMCIETAHSIDYVQVDYTVCGTTQARGQAEITLSDRSHLRLVMADGFVSPNEQTDTYFTISVFGVCLP